MIVNTYGDVMLTEDKGSKVWKVNCLGPRKEFFDASPFGTRCMCLAKNIHNKFLELTAILLGQFVSNSLKFIHDK
jgi:hypothetical protein